MYSRDIRIEFNHCDPAGIVFFPRYFEMVSSQVENFFRHAIDYPYERMTVEEDHGVPTVHLDTDFRQPSRLGDLLRFELRVRRLGRSSLDLHHVVRGADGSLRLEVRQRIVWVGPDGRSTPWPDWLRDRLAAHLEETA